MIGATQDKAQTDERMILKIKIVAPRSVKHDSNCSCCCSIAVALRNSIVCNRDVAETTEVPQLRDFILESLAKRKVNAQTDERMILKIKIVALMSHPELRITKGRVAE